MTEHAVVDGEFVTYSHIKTRKTFSIVIEFPEEQALHVLNTLGSPVGGNSKRVAVCLLNDSIVTKPKINCDNKNHIVTEKITTKGEKLRTRAVLLCREEDFQSFVKSKITPQELHSHNLLMTSPEQVAIEYLYGWCGIESRSELATSLVAQVAFGGLLDKYKDWQWEGQYADNLNR